MSADLYVALLHYPVVDKHRQIITASVTNMDIHDIARSCRTFDVKRYFIVHPSQDEQALNRRIIGHWKTAYGLATHPTRNEAVSLIELVPDFEAVEKKVTELSGKPALKVGTSARKDGAGVVQASALRERLEKDPVILVFGTGYGLAAEWNKKLDFFLAPICGPTDYNHLSVRSAVAIYLDRLRGE